jgi:glutamate dehydrogenase (NAD(P)+)
MNNNNNNDSSLTSMRSPSSAWEEMDEWGPEKVLQVYDPDTGMKGVLMIDNTATGPGKGGIRFAQSVTPLEVFILARTIDMEMCCCWSSIWWCKRRYNS